MIAMNREDWMLNIKVWILVIDALRSEIDGLIAHNFDLNFVIAETVLANEFHRLAECFS